MESCIRKLPTWWAAFFCIALILFSATTEIERVEAVAVCDTPSGTFRGPCIIPSKCEEHCRLNENALGGQCFVLACYCKVDCHPQ
ncbi:hypothetical protein K1719_039144 [Acacia pycnantha]|nr:hypothetical protein K1719_039144 [Acacia pycnantha]